MVLHWIALWRQVFVLVADELGMEHPDELVIAHKFGVRRSYPGMTGIPVVMTGAERYFAARLDNPAYAAAYRSAQTNHEKGK